MAVEAPASQGACCFLDGLQGALVSPSYLWLGTLAGFEAIQLLPLFAIMSTVTNTRGSQLTKSIGLLGHGFIGSSPQSVGPVTLRPVIVYNMSWQAPVTEEYPH